MKEKNVIYKNQISEWNLNEWDYIVKETITVFRLTPEEAKELYNSTTAKIIATIPFAANCEDAERTATAHIALYLTEKKGFQKYCAHLPSDDFSLFNRLELISHFKGGDLKIIQHGMNMLALIMIEGYKRSCQKDKQNKIYNPFTSNTWNYTKIKNKLLNDLSKTQCQLLDDLYYETITSPRW